MSHNIRYFEYDVSTDKKTIQSRLDNFVAHEDWQEGASGLPYPIRWQDDIIVNSYEDAEKWISDHDRGWYDQIAVKYLDTSRVSSKKIDDLKAKRSEVLKKLSAVEHVLYATTVKSAFIGCKKCGSKLASEYLRSNNCPLCRQDFRSQTTLSSIAAMHEKVNKLDAAIKEAQIAAGKTSANIKWLVKIEYHT